MRRLLTTAIVTAASVLALAGSTGTASAEPDISVDLSGLGSVVPQSTVAACGNNAVFGLLGIANVVSATTGGDLAGLCVNS